MTPMHTQEFGRWMQDQGFSPRTIALYRQMIRRAAHHCGDLDEATPNDLTAFVRTLPATRSSRAGARYALGAYYRYRGHNDGGPARTILVPPAPYRLPRPVAEYDRLLEAARQLGGRYQVLGELLYFTACRRDEVRRAAWHQFDLASDCWYIEGKGSKRRGPKVRRVPLHPDLASTLRAWRIAHPNDAYLFPSDRSAYGTVHSSTIGEWVETIGGTAGIAGATPHRWRHSTATRALERSGDIRAVQELLGHATLASTQLYTLVTDGRLTNVVGYL